GRDYGQSQFNRATQAQRQPGSAFKPFVYLAGLEAGLRPADHFVDAPIRVGDWQPHNYPNRYQGDMTLAEALAQSINTVAVQIAERAGIGRVIAAANRLGITSDLAKDASIALRTNEVNLLELVSAYAPFANGGTGILPYGIAQIRDPESPSPRPRLARLHAGGDDRHAGQAAEERPARGGIAARSAARLACAKPRPCGADAARSEQLALSLAAARRRRIAPTGLWLRLGPPPRFRGGSGWGLLVVTAAARTPPGSRTCFPA